MSKCLHRRQHCAGRNVIEQRELEEHPNLPEHGFTLVELVVVAVLLALMSGILYGTISGILRGRAIIESEQDTARVAQYVLERMSRELTSRAPIALSQREEDQRSTPIYSTDTLEGLDKQGTSNDEDQLRFVSINSGQLFFNTVPSYGLVEIDYHLEDSRQQQRSPAKGNKILVREEVPADVRSEEIRKQRRVAFPIADNVAGLNFRFRREGQWLSEWKNQGARLPEAVEITLTLQGSEGKLDTYRTAVFLMQSANRSR